MQVDLETLFQFLNYLIDMEVIEVWVKANGELTFKVARAPSLWTESE